MRFVDNSCGAAASISLGRQPQVPSRTLNVSPGRGDIIHERPHMPPLPGLRNRIASRFLGLTPQANALRPSGTGRDAILSVICFSIFCVAVTLVYSAFADEKGQALRADADYTAHRSDPINHDVDFSFIVTPPYQCKVLQVWVPVPQSDYAQQVGDSTFTTFPLEVKPKIGTEPVYGNRFAYFEFQNPKGAQIIRHRFAATVWNLHWNVEAENVRTVSKWPADFDRYLQAPKLKDEQELNKVLRQFTHEESSSAGALVAAMRWIDTNLQYDHVNASLKADADHAFSQRRGHCSDYHGLCATMGRALGHPSRVTYGMALFPKNSPSHCKMESYLPPYGWVSFDLSETQKLVATINANEQLSGDEKQDLSAQARARMMAGFRENSWLLLTKGTDYELVPKAAEKVRVVRTAYVEADGEALPDPDPANTEKREFAWMTSHKFTADKEFKLPFKDFTTLNIEHPTSNLQHRTQAAEHRTPKAENQ